MGIRYSPFAIANTDNTQKIWQPSEIYFPNGRVTDIGNGTVFVNTGPAGEIVEARTPLLKAGTILSLNTDGSTTNFLRGDGTYRAVYEARTPLLSAGTILSIRTDGTTTNFFRGDGTWAAPTASVSITQAEIDVGTTPVQEASISVTDASITTSSKIIGGVAYVAPTGKDLDELEMDALELKFEPLAVSSMNVHIKGLEGYIADKFKIWYTFA